MQLKAWRVADAQATELSSAAVDYEETLEALIDETPSRRSLVGVPPLAFKPTSTVSTPHGRPSEEFPLKPE